MKLINAQMLKKGPLLKYVKYIRLTQTQAKSPNVTSVVKGTYPIIIFDIDISFFSNKTFCCTCIAFSSCNVQGSVLMERNTVVVIITAANVIHQIYANSR